jgi:hypothetical protein
MQKPSGLSAGGLVVMLFLIALSRSRLRKKEEAQKTKEAERQGAHHL